jgi:hypothetical protein
LGGNMAPSGNNALTVLNKEFQPDGARVFQNLTNEVNAALGANLSKATTVLSQAEQDAAALSGGLAKMQYGNALERLVAKSVEEDNLLKTLFKHTGGPNSEDFQGIGQFVGLKLDITTAGQAAAHRARPYGATLTIITYERPPGFP